MTSPLGAANDLPALSVRRPYLATVLNLLIIVAGVAAFLGVEVRELPDVDRPIVTVRANLSRRLTRNRRCGSDERG